MSIQRGVIPTRWSPLRREVERILADGAWHETEQLYFQVERFVDPRIAMRSWAREYQHAQQRKVGYDAEDAEPVSRALVRMQEHALKLGKWRVYWDCLRMLRSYGHAQTQVWGGRRRVRIARVS